MHARQSFLLRLLLGFALLLGLASFARAQATSPEPTVEQIYQTASSGDLPRAHAMIDQVIQRHPNSARAHYVKAELASRSGDVVLAGRELSTAERLAPGLPFARPEAVQALRARVEGTGSAAGASRDGGRMGASPRDTQPASPTPAFRWAPLVVGAAVVLIAFALLRRRSSQRAEPMSMGPGAAPGPAMGGAAGWPAQPGAGVPPGAAPGYDPRYAPGAARPGMGSSIMGGLGTGLAVGAGALAAQEIGRRMLERGEEHRGQDAGTHDLSGTDAASFNPDLGGDNFGITDPNASWDAGADSAGGDDFGIGDGAGDDWNNNS